VALNKIFRHTSLQTSFGYKRGRAVDGVPRTLSLVELIRHYSTSHGRSSPAVESSSYARRRSARMSFAAT